MLVHTYFVALTQAMAALRILVEQQQPQHQQPGDDASVHGDHEFDAAANAYAHDQQFGQRYGGGHGDGGRGNGCVGAMPGVAREVAPLGACHIFNLDNVQQTNREDDGLGKSKFSTPNVEEYLAYE
jgi:hypothetical protein